MQISFFTRYGMSFGAGTSEPFDVEKLIEEARAVRDDGLATYWLAQQFDLDAITTTTVLGREVPGLDVGTAVVPMWTYHPVRVAQNALTAHLLTGGRFLLGLGLEHGWVVESVWKRPFERPVAHMEEYLAIVVDLLRTGKATHEGEFYNVDAFVSRFPPAPDLPVLLAALGPRMLRLASKVGDGTITWMTGTKTLSEHTLPIMQQAAEEAGRPTPRSTVLLPIAVTDDEAGTRARINEDFKVYLNMPSYMAMLEREGASLPADVAVVGTRTEVLGRLEQLAEIGVTDFGAVVFAATPQEEEDVRDVLRTAAKTLA